MTKLENGLTVKRLDNGMVGALEHLGGTAWKINYLDGTASYSSESKIKEHFFIQSKEPEDNSKCDGVEPKTIEELFEDYEPESDNGLIDNQKHYTANGIQPIEIMKANLNLAEYQAFLLGNVWKYTMRYKDKNGLQDLKKAKTYLTWLIEDIEERGL